MKRLRNLTALVCAILCCFSLAGCKSQSSNGQPSVLHMAFSPSEEELEDGTLRIQLMRKYLESQLHIPVEAVRISGYASTIEAMHAQKVDIATFGPLGYLIASRKAGAEAIVGPGDAQGKLGTYHSVIAVPGDSPIHSMDDFKAHSKDIVFSFIDPASTSGYLIPRAYLLSIGIDPDKDFKKVVFTGTHPAGAFTIMAHKVDAGTVSKQILDRLIMLNKMKPGDLRILWTSEGIPDSPYTVRSGLPDALKKKIQQALLDIPQKDPALWESIKKMRRRPDMTFIPVNDSVYDGLRKFAAQFKDFNFVEK